MTIHKLSSADAFIAFDYEDAPSVGAVRSAPKILQGGANHMARSITYSFAAFEMQRAGASAGVNAKPDERPEVLKAFVEEVRPLVAEGRFFPDPGKGAAASALAPLAEIDERNPLHRELGAELVALGAMTTAEKALGGLSGRTALVEGYGPDLAPLAAGLVERGARIVGVSTGAGAFVSPEGVDVNELGEEADDAKVLFAQEADVLFAGSKLGAVDHAAAESLTIKALVAHGPCPFTARALAVLTKAGAAVMPDFVALAGPLLAAWPDGAVGPDGVRAEVVEKVSAVLDETAGHTEGPFLGACYKAEAFLRTWRDSLPFGRPLAP